jgi:hypothetical protein
MTGRADRLNMVLVQCQRVDLVLPDIRRSALMGTGDQTRRKK